MHKCLKVLAISIVVSTLAGCVVAPQAPVANPKLTIRCVYPTISPLTETKESQTLGGVNIALAPGSFQCTKETQNTDREVAPDVGESMQAVLATGGHSETLKLVETTITPLFQVVPDRIAFRVKINNQMPRVFRGSGTVVLYNFGGKNTSTNQQDYAALNNLIVPPRTEAEVTIYGPSFKDMPDKTTLGIFLYDVVTKTDQAGNITEKQNFEWYYNYQHQYIEEVGEVTKTRKWVRR